MLNIIVNGCEIFVYAYGVFIWFLNVVFKISFLFLYIFYALSEMRKLWNQIITSLVIWHSFYLFIYVWMDGWMDGLMGAWASCGWLNALACEPCFESYICEANSLSSVGMYITVCELRSILCTKSPLYVRIGSCIKQIPLEHLSYIRQIPLEHLSYIKETSWNTSGRTKKRNGVHPQCICGPLCQCVSAR